MKKDIKLGIIGGSGIYNLNGLKEIDKTRPLTKYGPPSDFIKIYELKNIHGKKDKIAFLPRHGEKHSIPPHKIPYKANVAALKSLGVNSIISTSVVGSLKKKIKPGDFIVPDQFINLTWGRDDYFEKDKKILHLPLAEPYCQTLRSFIFGFLKKNRQKFHKKGTVVVVQGQRFSTKAESKWFIKQDWDIVNMTQYPENYFAREFGICYASICTVTDYDASVNAAIKMDNKNFYKVLEVFKRNTEKTKKILLGLIQNLEPKSDCGCRKSLLGNFYKE